MILRLLTRSPATPGQDSLSRQSLENEGPRRTRRTRYRRRRPGQRRRGLGPM